ncbi:tellurite resistance TerB family protein [Aquisalinus flavus]|uniref:Protein YebE n=1 Tax=Aquisalinus flavus TaxID=1526572 RepID=A0A8J2Y6Y1_9PROT|nr:tellurite resistance TerB family protein [Aquisalinus flavus]MBD0426336.1 tellurite resistance TerB family protein [Aquisalinus flavus]UNE48098.1 tellurite resistance TerB family protein [Aquisalinus flavus]GGD08787.1 protein YebE [Aquisalinus flavus]
MSSKSLLDQFLGDDKGGFARGAATGGLAGLVLGGKGGRKMVKNTAKIAGVAVVGGLAYKAWQDWQAKKQAEGSPQPSITTGERLAFDTASVGAASGGQPIFLPGPEEAQEALSRKLIRAMLAAAKADGHITPDERKRINARLAEMDLDAKDRDFVFAELDKPLDVDAVAKSAETPEEAVELYTASLIALDETGPAEKGYLAMLAARLELDPDLVAQLHVEVGHSVERAPVQI